MRVILHIGAHRTGTTALQACLAENLARLAAHGWAYWGPPVTRAAPFAKIVKNTRAARLGADTGEVSQQRAMIAGKLDEVAWSGRNLIVSDENICGTMAINVQKGSLYDRARLRMRVYGRLFEKYTLQTVFSIRAYDEFWSSSYAYCAGRDRLPATDDAADLALDAERGWVEVIEDMRQGQKSGTLRVVPHRGARDPRRLLAPLIGQDVAEGLRLSETLHNTSRDDATVRRAVGEAGEPGAKFSLFDEDEVEELQERYARDLNRLENAPPMARGIADLELENAPGATRAQESVM